METLAYQQYFTSLRQQHHGRMSIVKALRIIGLPPERIEAQNTDPWRNETRWRIGKKSGKLHFWERNADCLEEIAQEMKRIFRQHIRQIHPDWTADDEAAKVLIDAYTKAKKMFELRGVRV